MGGSLLDMMKELNKSMRESIDKMKKQKQSDPTEGEGHTLTKSFVHTFK